MKKSILMRMIVTSIAIVMTVWLATGLSACDALLDRFFGSPTTTTSNEQITTPSDETTHVHSVVVDEAIAPTCTETGLTEGKHCSTCNEVLVAQEVAAPALGHQYKNYICTMCGDRDGTPYLEFILLDNGTYSVSGIKPNPPSQFSIPSTYLSKEVTEIDFFTLVTEDFSTITSITIPDSVRRIGRFTFTTSSFKNLIQIENGIAYVDKWAIGWSDSETSLTFTEGTVGICEAAFLVGGVDIKSISIPNSVTNIGWIAFAGCAALENVTVADGNPAYYSENNCIIEKESKTLIRGCSNSVIPDDIINIDAGAFLGCSNSSFTIPNGVTRIGEFAFSACENLKSVKIPDSIVNIGDDAFSDCSSLTNITFEGTVEQWNAITFCDEWNNKVPATEVICSDGTVTLN